MSLQRTRIDAITTEIIRNAFISAASDMNATLIRSAYTPVIYEMKDCAVALLDEDHGVLGQSLGVPLFLGNLEICTKLTEERFGRDAWRPGDVWIMNDSYLTGTHLPDQTVFAPIFYEDLLAGFAASRAHWLDIGAKDPGPVTDSISIFQEGLRLGPTKVIESGVERADILDIIARNSRFPEAAMGDLAAQISVTRIGERRIAEIFNRFGRAVVAAARDEIFAQSERLDREAVALIPDGVYEAEGCLDNDGISDAPVNVRVRVEIAGDQMTIDLGGSSGPTSGPINCGEAQAISACRLAFKFVIGSERPVNGGTFQPLRVVVPEDSIFAAQPPVACEWYFSSLGLLIDLIVRALSPVMPQQTAAAHYGDSMVSIFTGSDEYGIESFICAEPHMGGWGAWEGSDGESALINSVNGALENIPIEIIETKYPLRVRRYGYRPDSAGAGRWRGGYGTLREYAVRSDDVWLSLWFERSKTPAWGLAGGQSGSTPDVTINPGAASEQHVLKASRIRLRRGDIVRLETGGGGGYGPAEYRDPAAIERDQVARLATADVQTRR
jgi:N-methylhydantoinase B